MMTLQEIHADRRQRREQSRAQCRELLRTLFQRLLASGTRVWVYGSLAKPGRFHEDSDIDLALESVRSDVQPWDLQREVSIATGRECDVSLMDECPRLAPRIRREGELWIV